MKLHARLVGPGFLAFLADTEIPGGDSDDGAFFIQDLVRGEAGEDLDAEALRLGGQPAAQVAEADDVVAVVPEAAGQQEPRGLERRSFC